MSAARDFLADLDRHGVRIVPNGDGLRLVPPTGKSVPPELVARGRVLKPALLVLLREPPEISRQPGDLLADAEAAEERSAIAEHDGGLARVEADFLGAASVAPLMSGETIDARERVVVHFADHFDRMRKRRIATTRPSGDAA